MRRPQRYAMRRPLYQDRPPDQDQNEDQKGDRRSITKLPSYTCYLDLPDRDPNLDLSGYTYIEPPPAAGTMLDCVRRIAWLWDHTHSGRKTLMGILEFRSMDGPLLSVETRELRALMEQLIKVGMERNFFDSRCGASLRKAWAWFDRVIIRRTRTKQT